MTTSATRHGDRTAIRQEGVALSYAGARAGDARWSPGCCRSRGVQPGDRVGVMLPNVAYFPICYYGALRAGAAIVPMNMLLKEREVAYYMADSGARVLFAWHEFAEAARAGARDAEVIVVAARGLRRVAGRMRAGRHGRPRARRHRGDPVHVRARRARPREPS